ncbi:Lsr2 family protein [Micromonospora sp. WMMA1363]|uniref:histone-like nucleoid-structuring protein Lsr2 n=1 Tax=Micromonospora sp. WMMA1363 TaxID=3053985 RepID=UPI00259D018B|nr:Lsr2 family protein [Micromonospora sp. WMMA1363]MDM4721862.1 Lsr2 family protein [Micromonospora sp. WMMA1363]
MARQTITQLIDDLDGGDADQSIEFSLDGRAYTIDLSDENATTLRQALSPFVAAGQRVGRASGHNGITRAVRGATASAQRSTRARNQEIREWASANGYDVSERGRIPVEVVEAYDNRESGGEPARTGKGKKAN